LLVEDLRQFNGMRDRLHEDYHLVEIESVDKLH